MQGCIPRKSGILKPKKEEYQKRNLSAPAIPYLCMNMFQGVHLTQGPFGAFRDAETGVDHNISKFTWTNNRKTTVEVINYGATITKILLPDKNNKIADVVLGFDDIDGYRGKSNQLFGATIGRVTNRIKNGKYKFEGQTFELDRNSGNNHINGGFRGFDKQVWKPYVSDETLILTNMSKHGDQGYPGDLLATIIMELTTDNEFIVTMQAMCTKPSPLNMSNLSLFNLAGHEAGPKELMNHVVSINGSEITDVDSQQIPTGNISEIMNTTNDFRIRTPLKQAFESTPNGFDTNYCITRLAQEKEECHFVGQASHPPSGRALEVYSNQPGCQFYTANGIPGMDVPEPQKQQFEECDPTSKKKETTVERIIGKQKKPYWQFGGLSLQSQKYPDAVNHDNFPSVMLVPGKVYRHKYIYKFRIQE